MPYLIFNKDKFIGFSLKKSLLKKLLKDRKKDYVIKDTDNLDEKLRLSIKDMQNYKLFHSNEYNGPVFGYEILAANSVAATRITELHTSYIDLKRLSIFIKFTDEEKKIFYTFFLFIERMMDDLMHPESCVKYDEYVDMKGIYDILINHKQ